MPSPPLYWDTASKDSTSTESKPTVTVQMKKMNQLESHADRDQLGDDSEASDSEQQLSEEAKALLQTADEEAARWQNVRVVLHPLRQSTDDVLAGDTCASGMQL